LVGDAVGGGPSPRLYAQNLGREAVAAFKAGNDMLLIPPDIGVAEQALVAAVRSGEISESRLDQSVTRILRLKASLGLNKGRLIDLSALDTSVGRPENISAGEQMAQDALTWVRAKAAVLPLKRTASVSEGVLPYQARVEVGHQLVVVIFSDDVRLAAGRALERQIRSRVPDVNVIYTDP